MRSRQVNIGSSYFLDTVEIKLYLIEILPHGQFLGRIEDGVYIIQHGKCIHRNNSGERDWSYRLFIFQALIALIDAISYLKTKFELTSILSIWLVMICFLSTWLMSRKCNTHHIWNIQLFVICLDSARFIWQDYIITIWKPWIARCYICPTS